jgi:hypothetical protein
MISAAISAPVMMATITGVLAYSVYILYLNVKSITNWISINAASLNFMIRVVWVFGDDGSAEARSAIMFVTMILSPISAVIYLGASLPMVAMAVDMDSIKSGYVTGLYKAIESMGSELAWHQTTEKSDHKEIDIQILMGSSVDKIIIIETAFAIVFSVAFYDVFQPLDIALFILSVLSLVRSRYRDYMEARKAFIETVIMDCDYDAVTGMVTNKGAVKKVEIMNFGLELALNEDFNAVFNN